MKIKFIEGVKVENKKIKTPNKTSYLNNKKKDSNSTLITIKIPFTKNFCKQNTMIQKNEQGFS